MTGKEHLIATDAEDDDFLLLEEEILSAENRSVVHRRQAPKETGRGMLIRVVILFVGLIFLAALGYYYFAGTVVTEELIAPSQSTSGADSGIAGETPAVVPTESQGGTGYAGRPETESRPQAELPVVTQEIPPAAALPSRAKEALPPSPAPAQEHQAAPVAKPGPNALAPPAQYLLQAGVFLQKSSMEKAEKIIRGLGYEPQVTTQTRETEMTRLLVGTFPPAEARSFLTKLKPRVPEAFMLSEGEWASVFAGSFSVPAEARKMAGHLAAEGIAAKPVVVKLPMTVFRLTFGAFDDRAAALAAAEKAQAAGLEKPLIERR